MPWRPAYPGERPTLGHDLIAWGEEMLASPDGGGEYAPMTLTREQAEFVLRFYELDPITGKRLIRRAVLSRPRGWGKSPFAAFMCILEALADVVPDGWDADGRPVGKPWALVKTPLVQIAAVSDDQVMTNTYSSLSEMLDTDLMPPVFDHYRELEPLGTFVNLPGRGRIVPITASGSTAKGARPIFMAWDQTEEWFRGNGGHKFAKILADNIAKTGGSYMETPNAFEPGGDSVAERSAQAWVAIQEGRAKRSKGLLYDHREAPGDTDLTDYDSLITGLRIAYGDSSAHPSGCAIHEPPCEPGWADLDDRVARIWDPDNDEQNARANLLGQITHATDAWLSQPEWNACTAPDVEVRKGELITLGFDGSRGRSKGKPDASALIACRVSDGHVWKLWIDEADDDPKSWKDWSPNIPALESVLTHTFRDFRVAAFYADPGRDWRSHVNAWEGKWGRQVRKPASANHPFEWWMTGGRASLVEQAVEVAESAVRGMDMTHSGDLRLSGHVLNARRRVSHGKLALDKESSSSSRKIDAAIAFILAFQARLDVLASGKAAPAAQAYRPKRIY